MHRSAPLVLSLLCAGAAAPALLAAGCRAVECGPGTVEKVDPQTNGVQCVPQTNALGANTPCNLDAGARVVGNRCEGDPAQFPSCGPGTVADPKTNTCVPAGGGTPIPPPCSKPADPKKMCINGVVRYLKDFSYTRGRTLEVRAFDPFAFLANPQSLPIAVARTDANGTYILPEVEAPGLGTIAVAVTDIGGPNELPLSGSGAKDVVGGGLYQVDLFAVEKSLVTGWDEQLSFVGADTFRARGAYVGIFVNGPNTDSPPVAGVTMTYAGKPAPDQYFFKRDRATIDGTAKTTDTATGSALQRISASLGTYSGTGGGVSQWESGPGTSVPGVVFVQVFHPAK